MTSEISPRIGIPVSESIAEWMKDPEFRAACKELDEKHGVGDAMAAARLGAGMTQAEVAGRMGTTQTVVARLEGGGTSPSIRTLKRFAEATGKRLRVWFEDGKASP